MQPMKVPDATLLQETETLGESPRPVSDDAETTYTSETPAEQWATLREAYYLTGIPVETLRKWARRDTVATFLDEADGATRRMVGIDAVRGRAARLGRKIAPVARPEMPSADTEAAALGGTGAIPAMQTAEEVPPAQDGIGTVPGTMIVPVAAWDKMLMQLGNLHQAGQQLAEARERAAKAETESRFLRERLSEMRTELQGHDLLGPEPSPDLQKIPAAAPDDRARDTGEAMTADPPRGEKLWRYVYRGWRARRR